MYQPMFLHLLYIIFLLTTGMILAVPKSSKKKFPNPIRIIFSLFKIGYCIEEKID